MATSVETARNPLQQEERLRRALFAPSLVSLLTLFALVVHGYHPYAEDGGLYLAGVKHLLNPTLFTANLPFVTAHLHYSLFAPALAAACRITHLRLDSIALLGYVASLWATLYGIWVLSSRCFAGRWERVSATLVFAAWLTLPVAGTSLLLVDPYLTARSVSTPAILLLLAGTLDLRGWRSGTALPLRSLGLVLGGAAVAIAFHPLMAAYGLCCAALVFLLDDGRSWYRRSAALRRGLLMLALTGLVCVAALLLERSAPAESAAYRDAVLTRSYWFLSEWQWFEVVGLLAPLAILAAAMVLPVSSALRSLVRASLAAGLSGTEIAMLFAHTDAATHAVARLQPMRVLQILYVVVLLLIGSALNRLVLRGRWWRYALAAPVLGAPLFLAARATFPASPQVELFWSTAPASPPRNPWVAAFLWARANTSKDALFAIDADYISREGEDAQSFRAIAERSVLPDQAKDGGESAITPALAGIWRRGEQAQVNLNREEDAARLARLQPFGVSWLLLESSSRTALHCDYDNGTVKLCRMPPVP